MANDRLRTLTWSALVVAGVIGLVATPRAGALFIRAVFGLDTRRVRRGLELHRPAGITVLEDQSYDVGDPDATLDVYFPAGTSPDDALPTLVWVHGGAWLSGDKSNDAGYFALVASHGYTVVSVNYSLAPGSTYPAPVHQVNRSLSLLTQGDRLHVDAERIVLAGDSAGAQIASQIACLVTDPTYAESLGVLPALAASQLRAVILFCGFYDMRTFIDRGAVAPIRFLRWGIKTMVRAYTGSRATDSPAIRQMSTLDHVTADFPPTFISGGNGDPLTNTQSRPFAAKLQRLGVPVTSVFYPEDHDRCCPTSTNSISTTQTGRGRSTRR